MDQLLTKRIESAATDAFQGSEVFLAYAYGSRINGQPLPGSDLDIGYYLKDWKQSLSIREEMLLADKLSTALSLEVDLRNLADGPLELRGKVVETGIRIFCSDEVARVNLERNLLGMYHDYKYEIEAMHRLRIRAVAESGV